MNILMISEKDAANISLSKMADAYIRNGHTVKLFAVFFDKSVLRFFDEKIDMKPLSMLTQKDIDEVDVIVTSTVAAYYLIDTIVMTAHKPIFTQSYLIDKTIQWRGDFCFAPSLPTLVSDFDEYFTNHKIGIGEPKYDNIKKDAKELKRFLFIDSGHRPFGPEGKRELARTLLNICEKFPDYELVIKPRFLPTDKIFTHKNGLHLFDVLKNETNNNLPKNLTMLTEHKDLQELIESSHTVICMYTTAFVGAYASDKGLVILEGIKDEDNYDLRLNKTYKLRTHMEGSGALINYKDVAKILPDGVKCSDEYFHYLLAEKENVADKITEVTEYLVENFYKKGLFPKYVDCLYKDYKEKIKVDNEATWDEVIRQRFINQFVYNVFILIDYNIEAKLNVDKIVAKIKYMQENKEISDEKMKEYIRDIRVYRDECIAENKDALMANDVDAGIYLNALYALRRFDDIRNFEKKDIGAYHLFRGFVAYDTFEDKNILVEELKKYLEITLSRDYVKEVSDMSNNKTRAFYMIITYLYKMGRIDEAKEYYDKMEKYYCWLYNTTINDKVTDKLQGQHYSLVKWLCGKVNDLPILENEDKVFIYGVGTVSKIIFFDDSFIERVGAFIDLHSTMPKLKNVDVINPEDILKYPRIKTVVVTIIDEFDDIKENLLKIRNDLNIIPITKIYDV